MGPGIVVSAPPPSRIQRAGASVIVGASGQITAQATAGQAIQLSANGATFSVTAAGAVTIAPLAGQSTTISNGQLLGPAGTAAAPTYSFAANSNTGIGNGGVNNVSVASAAGWVATFDGSARLRLGSGMGLDWAAAADPIANGSDLSLRRVAASILGQYLGTTAQEFQVYNTRTNATDNEYGAFRWTGAANVLEIGTVKGSGGGTARTLSLITDATSRVTIHATTGLMDALYGVNVPTGSAYTYNGVAVVRAQTALNNYYFGPSGNLTGTGTYNVATGVSGLGALTSGSYNVVAGYGLTATTTGDRNTAYGHGTLTNNIGGADNTAVGYNAGYNGGVALSSLTYCTFIGQGANSSVNAITNSTAIGNGAQVTASNQVVIGNASITDTLIKAGNLNVQLITARSVTQPIGGINLFNGTAPAGTLANGATFYVVAGEMTVMDAGGVATTISPHDDDGKWVFDSKDTVKGTRLLIDVERMLRFVNEHHGLDFVHDFAEKVN